MTAMRCLLAAVVTLATAELPPHPRLLVNATQVAALRARILGDATLRRYYADVLATGTGMLGTTPITYPNCTVVGACRNAAVFGTGANYIDASGARAVIQTCSFLHIIGLDNVSSTGGGGTVWSARAALELSTISAFVSWYWPVGEALERAGLAFAAAIGYDWLNDVLPPALLRSLEDAMGRLALTTRANDELQGMWWTSDPYNWNVNSNAPLLAVTLAIGDVPAWAAAAASVQALLLRCLPSALATFAPDGVWPEGPAYQKVATEELLRAAAMLRSATGSDGGLLATPGLCGSGLVSMVTSGASTGAVFNHGDAGEGAPPSIPLFGLADACSVPAYAAYARMLRAGGGANVEDVLWYSDAGNSSDVAALPLTSVFADPSSDRSKGAKTHVAALRSAWLDGNATFVAVKGGDNHFDDHGTASHNDHNHLDIGSFVLESGGTRWAVDLGSGAYDYPLLAYFGRFRFGYALTSSYSHNVLSFDGLSQHRRGQGRIVASSVGAMPFAALDTTSAHGGAASVVRNVSLTGRVVTIADTWVNPSATTARFQFLTTAAVQLQETSAVLVSVNGASLRVAAVASGGAVLSWVAPEFTLPPPQAATHNGLPVFVVSVDVPAAEGGLTVTFTPL